MFYVDSIEIQFKYLENQAAKSDEIHCKYLKIDEMKWIFACKYLDIKAVKFDEM